MSNWKNAKWILYETAHLGTFTQELNSRHFPWNNWINNLALQLMTETELSGSRTIRYPAQTTFELELNIVVGTAISYAICRPHEHLSFLPRECMCTYSTYVHITKISCTYRDPLTVWLGCRVISHTKRRQTDGTAFLKVHEGRADYTIPFLAISQCM